MISVCVILMLSVSKAALGLAGKAFTLQFKWADSYADNGDIWSFYINGDCAPYGRMNYVYSGT